MKRILNILKFVIVFIVFLEAVSQLMGFQEMHYLYILGIYKVAKTPNLSDWERIYDAEMNDTIAPVKSDPKTGWTFRPYNVNFRYTVNNDGLRGSRNYSIEKPDSVIRVGLFGNSAMFSAEVSDSQALAVYLEEILEDRGFKVEVLNLAIPAFGIDQSYLHWKEKGKKYDLDIVVCGVQEMAFWANQVIFMYNYLPQSGTAHFSKPRAIIENNKLKWINYPVIAPEKMIDSIVLRYEEQPFYQYEYFKKERRHGQRFYENLYLYQTALGMTFLDKLKIEDSPEGKILEDSLFRIFKRDVEQSNSEFIMMTMPSITELTVLRLGQDLVYQDFLDDLAKGQNYYSTFDLLSKETDIPSLFEKGFHYSMKGNKILAEDLANYLIEKKFIKNQN